VATILDTWMNFRQGSLSFNSFIGQFDNFVQELKSINSDILPDSLALSRLIVALSSNQLKLELNRHVALANSNDQSITYQQALKFLRSFVGNSLDLNNINSHANPSSAQVNQSASAQSAQVGPSVGRAIKCWNCGENHHLSKCQYQECKFCSSGEHAGKDCPHLLARLAQAHQRMLIRNNGGPPGQLSSNRAILDSGASSTFVNNRSLITEKELIQRSITVANGATIEAISRGTLKSFPKITADFVPKLQENLISLGALANEGNIFIGDKNKITVIEETQEIKSAVEEIREIALNSNLITIEGNRCGSLYYTDLKSLPNNLFHQKEILSNKLYQLPITSSPFAAHSIHGPHGLHFQNHQHLVLYYHDLFGHIGLEALVQLVRLVGL
jgi:hypothetical protein